MIDPIVMFFILGIVAGLVRDDLRLPAAAYDVLSLVLLLAIGLKGGVELASQPVSTLAPQILVVAALGVVLTLIAYAALRLSPRLAHLDAASIAAHYGSVSVGTYAVGVSYLTARNIDFEDQVAVFVVVLEIPGIIVGVLLAKGSALGKPVGRLAHEVFLGKSILLLLGGLAIGWAAGPDKIKSIEPLFFDLFGGVLALFLLDMGLVVARQLYGIRSNGAYLIGFGILFPLVGATAGIATGAWLGLSEGGVVMMAVLGGSSSYIAVPAAMRMSVPEANPALSLGTSLGVTFPFNVIVGVPLYHQWSQTIRPYFSGG
jgi:hypothetical protein